MLKPLICYKIIVNWRKKHEATSVLLIEFPRQLKNMCITKSIKHQRLCTQQADAAQQSICEGYNTS